MSDDDDDDWFEQAVGSTESDGETEDDAGGDDGAFDDFEDEFGGDPDGEDFAEAMGGDPEGEDFAEAMGGGSEGGDDEDDDGSPFDRSFAEELQSAPDPGGGGGGGGFGGGGGGGFGGGGGEGGAQAGFPGGGPGGPGGPGGFEADEEEFESELDRIDLGIEGLDAMILGGVPERSLISIIGSAGTGKTTFGLQFLNEALRNGKRGVYISLEESNERLFNTAEEKGWPFREYTEEGRLALVHLDPIEMANSLTSIRSDLPQLIEEFGADRLVLDSVSLLEMMYDHPSDRRSEVFQFSRSLKEAGVTTFVTSEADNDDPYTSKYGIIEYLADAVFVLRYVRPSDFQETRLALEIQKIRDASHSRETKPYELTNDGISVYRQANIF